MMKLNYNLNNYNLNINVYLDMYIIIYRKIMKRLFIRFNYSSGNINLSRKATTHDFGGRFDMKICFNTSVRVY